MSHRGTPTLKKGSGTEKPKYKMWSKFPGLQDEVSDSDDEYNGDPEAIDNTQTTLEQMRARGA